ncbi:class I SAM-dependent methyltransferase [Methanobacterium alkalithermotolerans]|uniref:Class I SAM-dependent methyltransferase n=1 Tax=Methanobacterium alkalithermotolerans TaxID=2731220 RepID=A0A8T8K518_9EURY|nr:class I SAM-dependent methyltransferase [Methanobacterium alkalithermotolerans]QUH23087.1 class I SAM-dependent methyltransferase [Methanobacterium alkalithermotolerans]
MSGNKIWFLGRGFEEYLLMFNLNLNNLKNCRILDCNAGASSFTTHMHKRGYDVTAADMLYGPNPEDIEKITSHDFKTLMDAHKGLEDKVEWGFFKDLAEMMAYREKCYKEFYQDYKNSFNHRYVPEKLPDLNFPDKSFHLVLSSHLLFLYDDRLDYEFHLDSIREMLRVSRDEVRIYPIISINGKGKHSTYLKQIIEDLSPDYYLDIQPVKYQFRRGANEMLCIKKINRNRDSCGLVTYDAIKVEGK